MKKFEIFLKIAKELNKKLGVTPVLYGSLGLSVLLRVPLQINDIDILVPERFVSDKWVDLCELMKGFNFGVKDEKEHEFEKGSEIVAFASTDVLADVKLTVDNLREKAIDGATFKELVPGNIFQFTNILLMTATVWQSAPTGKR